jgi:hypothetical protein
VTNRPGQSLFVIERILRDRQGIWQQIIAERDLGQLTRQLLTSSVVSLAIYGAVLGASNSGAQALSSFVKLPLLFLATLAICLPTLYLFNLVFGARLSVMQAVTLIMVCITVTAVLTLAFAPISLFFLISAHNYNFFKLLNVTILVLTAIVGLRFLTNGMHALNEYQTAKAREREIVPVSPAPAPAEVVEVVELEPVAAGNGATPPPAPPPVPLPAQPPGPMIPNFNPALVAPSRMQPMHPHQAPHRPVPSPLQEKQASMGLLYIWILLFGFVGTQLAWTLRPFFGDPDRPFALFRKIEGTFYMDIIRTIGHLLTG